MKSLIIVLLVAAAASSAVATPLPAQDWNASVRGRELEAKYLHSLIDEAKATGNPINPAWIERLHELEPLIPRDETPSVNSSWLPERATPPEDRDPLDQGQDNCPGSLIIGLPFTDIGTTAGRANNFTPEPLGCPTASNAPDVIYRFQSPIRQILWVALDPNYNATIYVRAGATCPGSEQVRCIEYSAGPAPEVMLGFTADSLQTYWFIIDGQFSDAGSYTFWVSANCSFTCAQGTVPECAPDTYPNDCNPGCSGGSQAPLVQTIIPGVTVCGHTYNGDQDAYEFTIAQACTVRWTVYSEIGVLIGFGDAYDPCGFNNLNRGYRHAMPCMITTQATFLSSGTYRAYVFSPSGAHIGSDPGIHDYTATLSTSLSNCDLDGLIFAPGSAPGNTQFAINRCGYRLSSDQTIGVIIPHFATWRFSLCASPELWDAFLYLSSICCGTASHSNDDACSELPRLDACLTAGTYYVTVEGFASNDYGDFVLDVTEVHGACCLGDSSNPQCQDELLTCDCIGVGGTFLEGQNCANVFCGPRPLCQDDAQYGQLPFLATENWNATFSDVNTPYLSYDNFSGASRPISAVRFWGFALTLPAGAPCVEQPQSVLISFHSDSSGFPARANPVAQYSLSVTGTLIGSYQLGGNDYSVYQYEAVLPATCTLTSGWLSISGKAAGGVPGCNFAWLYSPHGNGFYRQTVNGGGFSTTPGNLAFCLATQAACAIPLLAPQEVTCNSIPVAGARRIQLSWEAPSRGSYEIWSTIYPNNDGNPNGGLDTMWHLEARVNVGNPFGKQTWTDLNSINALYKNYVILQVCRPPNFICEQAIEVTNGPTKYTNINADLAGPAPSCADLGSVVWFKYVATCTGDVFISTCTGTSYDSEIGVFTGPCGSQIPIACNNDFCGFQARAAFEAIAGNTYYLRVGGSEGAQGNGVITISCQ